MPKWTACAFERSFRIRNRRSHLPSTSRPELSIMPNSTDSSAPPDRKGLSSGALLIAGLVIVLLILHQDNWLWHNDTLLFGFMPIGLAWHAGISIAASFTWFLATRVAWPLDEEEPQR